LARFVSEGTEAKNYEKVTMLTRIAVAFALSILVAVGGYKKKSLRFCNEIFSQFV
jgi:hypothetical protein